MTEYDIIEMAMPGATVHYEAYGVGIVNGFLTTDPDGILYVPCLVNDKTNVLIDSRLIYNIDSCPRDETPTDTDQ